MGAFLLRRRNAQDSADAQATKILACFESQGFAAPRALSTPDWDLYLFRKYAAGIPINFVEEGGAFAAYSGTLIYSGTTASEALTLIRREFRAGTLDWEKFYGSYCLIIYENQQLHLIQDKLGLYKIYQNDSGSLISSSFIAALEGVARPSVNAQSVYEYVFQGATYDHRTVIDQVRLLERGVNARRDPTIRVVEPPGDLWNGAAWEGFEAHVALCLAALHREFAAITAAFGNNIDSALSGGYDSRLLLALLRARGAAPRVHVYGEEGDTDVLVAKSIAAGEGFAIEHIDKRHREISPEQLPAIVAKNFARFDGYPTDGIFDNGADLDSRLARAEAGAVALNGGGGEIFRNFFYLADRPFSVRQVLWAFFSQFDPGACTKAFSEREYLANMARAILRVLGLPETQTPGRVALSRTQVEYLYPCLRCVYWMGRNNNVNNRFGYATTPFVEPSLIRLALQMPIAAKNHGRFEAALIRGAAADLAKYSSAYGHNYLDDPPLRRILSDRATLLRPPFIRKFSYRLHRQAASGEVEPWLRPDSIKKVIDPSFPEMSRYFRVGRVRKSEFKRICTLEYLFERYGPTHAP